MRVLVIGAGAREHSIIWKLICSRKYPSTEILAAPGNGGVSELVECLDLDINDIDRLLEIAIVRNVDLTIVGPQELISKGIADKFREAGKLICAPGEAAAKICSSQYFAKELMYDLDIKTPKYASFDNYTIAQAYLSTLQFPAIIRADNPNSIPESVIKVSNIEEAKIALHDLFNVAFKQRVVFEEFIEGTELSLVTVSDGDRVLFFPPVQNYTNLFDGGEGPYAHGMGAYAPTPIVTDEELFTLKTEVVDKTLEALRNLETPYVGILSFDFKVNKEGIHLLQYRVGFSANDAQVILPLCDEDLYDLLSATARANLSRYEQGIKQYLGSALSLNLVSNSEIEHKEVDFAQINSVTCKDDNLEAMSEVLGAVPLVFHEETQKIGDKYLSKGSRIVSPTAVAENLVDAQVLAYKLAEKINFPGKHYRKDIGDKGML